MIVNDSEKSTLRDDSHVNTKSDEFPPRGVIRRQGVNETFSYQSPLSSNIEPSFQPSRMQRPQFTADIALEIPHSSPGFHGGGAAQGSTEQLSWNTPRFQHQDIGSPTPRVINSPASGFKSNDVPRERRAVTSSVQLPLSRETSDYYSPHRSSAPVSRLQIVRDSPPGIPVASVTLGMGSKHKSGSNAYLSSK